MSAHWIPIAFLCVTSFISTALLVPVAHKVKLLDIPHGRKDHAGNIPLVGGLGIYISVILGCTIFCELNRQLMGLLALGGLITVTGLIDDKFDISAKFRLMIQILASLGLATGAGLSLQSVGDIIGIGSIQLGLLAIPVTVLAVAGITNAYNMTDGIDGLAGSMSLIAILGLLITVYPRASESEINLLCFFAVSISVFLIFNLKCSRKSSKKIFMGDAGSMFLGFVIAGLMIYFTQKGNTQIKPITALWLIAVPLIDMVSTMIRRVLKKQSPLNADKTHLHHILIKGGLSSRQSLITIIIYSCLCAIIGISLSNVPQYISTGVFGLVFFIHLYILRHAYKASKKVKYLLLIIGKARRRKILSY
ncbi:undecaprenyl/decaprenyl-phosphate alpha-N-acetylglucosaminyl 1-phosphate transferase [Porticoccus sp. W117]|uniref:undecaprenyl/decaprenyl-phosphate alpha-N-acetylglucosaminyl 1-phosphate transferase n=1 Tax=Porticoccus sp. W117 TaxID=3054777 RepID=UPI002597EB8C|nr:undecaprenyl/decaprenyl-phosphate alpha-N-acetylglucosaminyl 1-phosphate transferase [Porticoccus sp. W117]MDM3872371.1 undecaprenyl/decaprenyl-phosphate alpha-N-acetylglucosaminyl 1-phosphate transferase [Porticoccus sp. W117]